MARYDKNDIETIKNDKDRMQQMAHLYIPDKKLAGCLHTMRELIDNSTDEVIAAGGTVDVYYDERDRDFKITDTGRGMPLERLQELCEVLHSSGKFDKGNDHAYNTAGGMNGVGIKIAVYLSDYFELTSTRDGKSVTRYYENGDFVKEKVEKVAAKHHGTSIRFRLSDKFLSETNKVTCSKIQRMIEEKTDCSEELSLTFHGINKNGKKIEEKYKGHTIKELFDKYMSIESKKFKFGFTVDGSSYEIVLGWNTSATEGSNLMGWCNFIYQKDGGVHVDAIPDTLYDVFKRFMLKEYFSEKEKKDLQIKRDDIKLGLCGVVVVKTSKNPLFYGQFKQKATAQWIYDDIHSHLYKELNKLSASDMKDISKIIKDNIKVRMSAQKAKETVKRVGNGLTNDIPNYIKTRMGVTTDYNELYIVEGKSAGGIVEQARYDFQGLYKLRGKVDNIYDLNYKDMAKSTIISELSRIIGIPIGGRGKIIPDRILGLTDADPDGGFIRSGLVVIMACAFPQVIEEGRLYMVEPPLFSFTNMNGKRQFVATNREYLTYLQELFSKKNVLYRNGSKMSSDAVRDFLYRNERYMEYLKEVANNNICSMPFTELIISNINRIGIGKETMSDWKKLIKKNFSDQLKVEWEDGRITINGIKDGNWESIELDDTLLNNKKTKKLINVMESNLGKIYGYSVESNKNKYENLSIYDVLKIFNKYSAKDLHRYKGLGEMSASDLRNTCMDPKRQRCVQITAKDLDKARMQLANWHSKKETYRLFRKDYMSKYIPDLQDIST